VLTKVLAIPTAYRVFARLITGNGLSVHVTEHVRPRPGDRILDIGCGPGDVLKHLPDVSYLGLDSSAKYIQAAQDRYGKRGRFIQADIRNASVDEPGSYDLVLATGVLHHLDDEVALALFRLARLALRPYGRLVTIDGCFEKSQPAVATLLLRLDRGKFVRTLEGYMALASQVFPQIKSRVRHDLLRMAYSHLILECRAEESAKLH
jgi:SAM-dependent methyltransferase